MTNPLFPPVQPLYDLEPWDGGPQQLVRGRADLRARRGPMSLLVPGADVPSSAPLAAPPIWSAEAHRYATCITGVFGATTVSARILDAPTTYRNLLGFRNLAAAATMYIEFGRDATTQSVVALAPGQFLMFDTVVPQDDIYVLSTVAAQSIALLYSTVALPAPV